LIAKITYETVTGLTIFVSNAHSGMVPVPLAHLVGAALGTGIGLLKDSVITGRSAVSDCHPRIQQAPVDTAGNQ
jgi:hypothetical protein